MTDGQDIVKRALNECSEEFKRGVHSFHGSSGGSDLIIGKGVVEKLQGLLEGSFEDQLKHPDPAKRREWEKDKKYVFPMAFYTGAVAACYVHNTVDKQVTKQLAEDALRHVSEFCQGPDVEPSDTSGDELRARWRYCPTWPAVRFTEDDVISAIEKSEVVLPPAADLKRSKKTVTVGCVKIPLPFLKLEVCVDLRFNW